MNKLKGKELELLLAILPDNNGSLYGMVMKKVTPVCHLAFLFLTQYHINFCDIGDLKRICETDLGLISQCCLTKHVFKINKQYLANVSLKINVKVR